MYIFKYSVLQGLAAPPSPHAWQQYHRRSNIMEESQQFLHALGYFRGLQHVWPFHGRLTLRNYNIMTILAFSWVHVSSSKCGYYLRAATVYIQGAVSEYHEIFMQRLHKNFIILCCGYHGVVLSYITQEMLVGLTKNTLTRVTFSTSDVYVVADCLVVPWC